MGVARRSDPALLAGAIGVAVAGVELLAWSVVAGGLAVVAVVVGSRLVARIPVASRRVVLVTLLAAGALALAAVAPAGADDPAKTAIRALGALSLGWAAWLLRRPR